MNADQRKKFDRLVSAIFNAGADNFREEKLIFAEVILRGKTGNFATAVALPNYSLDEQLKKQIGAVFWENDALVNACKALLRVACPELMIPSREEMVADLNAAALKDNCRAIDRLKIHKFAAELAGYVEPKATK